MKAIISQREARRLKQRVEQLERERREERQAWCRDYPNGIHFGSVTLVQESRFCGKLEAAQMLGRVLVAKLNGSSLDLYAVA